VFASLADDWTHVAWEEVVARKPALIVVNAYDLDDQGDARDKRAKLRTIPGLRDVPVIELPLRAALGGLGSLDALAALRAALEPT
jgi:hypothetical protein